MKNFHASPTGVAVSDDPDKNGIVQIFRLASDLDSGKQRRQRD
jgi:hypothetical protein